MVRPSGPAEVELPLFLIAWETISAEKRVAELPNKAFRHVENLCSIFIYFCKQYLCLDKRNDVITFTQSQVGTAYKNK